MTAYDRVVEKIDAYRAQKVADAGLAFAEITDSDIANAQRLVRTHGADIRFTPERGWLVWDGTRWAPDEKALAVAAKAKDVALAIFDEVKHADRRDETYRHARRSQSRQAIDNMVYLARSETGIPLHLTSFDADPWLLNCANGTIDLKTGALRPHDRANACTKIAGTTFDADADCAKFDAFLAEITGHDIDLYNYLWKFAGYALTGLVTEQTLHFLYGTGANGKSVLCEILLALLGEYGLVASPDLVMARRHGGIPNDVARLRGVRLAVMNETSQGSRFDEAKLKDLTGGDTLSARFLREEFFDFRPTHKLVIRGNHKPVIHGTDDGIWRRLRLVPFNVAIPAERQDPHLFEKLRDELPGILGWAVRGCLEWQRNGLRPPAVITDAVSRYREESDTLGRFIAECCEVRKLAEVKSSALFSRYQQFCEQSSERWLSAKDLPLEMERRGFVYKRTETGRRYLGVELKTTLWGPE
jgi:putative DNA primase/helicase